MRRQLQHLVPSRFLDRFPRSSVRIGKLDRTWQRGVLALRYSISPWPPAFAFTVRVPVSLATGFTIS